jgi:hypothetical protein
VRRSSSPLSSGRLYKTPVRRRRLPHAHKSRYKAPTIRAICRAAVGSNPVPGLSASQPPKQHHADDNNKQNSQLHGSCSHRLSVKSPLLTIGHSECAANQVVQDCLLCAVKRVLILSGPSSPGGAFLPQL